jgi:hypothetical protein
MIPFTFEDSESQGEIVVHTMFAQAGVSRAPQNSKDAVLKPERLIKPHAHLPGATPFWLGVF